MTTTTEPPVRARRVYDPPDPEDGTRILVDRLWPRGLAKDRAAVDLWEKEIAPSSELRKWYGHDPDRYQEFSRRYRAELDGEEQTAALERLRALAAQGTVTLLTATREIDHSQIPVLVPLISGSADRGRSGER